MSLHRREVTQSIHRVYTEYTRSILGVDSCDKWWFSLISRGRDGIAFALEFETGCKGPFYQTHDRITHRQSRVKGQSDVHISEKLRSHIHVDVFLLRVRPDHI